MSVREDQIRRQKIRRRKQSLRRRRRKRIRMCFRFLLCCVMLVLVLSGAKKLKDKLLLKEQEPEQASQTDDGEEAEREEEFDTVEVSYNGTDTLLARQVKDLVAENADWLPILEQIRQYPERMLEAFVNNQELDEYLLNYPGSEDTGVYKRSIDISEDYEKGDIPLFLQWDQRWGYAPYAGGMIGLDGCGPTCLSMVLVGLTGNTDMTPAKVAQYSQENGYANENVGTSWDLMTEGAKNLGLRAKVLSLDEAVIRNQLGKGNLIICSMRPGDFTTTGHFIVLTGYRDGKISVHDPNSRIRSEKQWTYEEIRYQIKNLWGFSK